MGRVVRMPQRRSAHPAGARHLHRALNEQGASRAFVLWSNLALPWKRRAQNVLPTFDVKGVPVKQQGASHQTSTVTHPAPVGCPVGGEISQFAKTLIGVLFQNILYVLHVCAFR